MAQQIVAKRSSNLNLSRHQVALFQKIIFVGGQMAGVISHSKGQSVLPKEAMKYANQWSDLMCNWRRHYSERGGKGLSCTFVWDLPCTLSRTSFLYYSGN